MNIKLTSLLHEQRRRRIVIAGISFLIGGHKNRLHMIPETSSDLDELDSRGKDVFIQDEIFPFLESSTGVQWQYDKSIPSAGFVFEIDFDNIIKKL
jgi:hypothetical protein